MIKQIKKIKSKNIDFNNLENSHLSIQLRLDGFSFCVFNKDIQEITALSDFDFPETNPSPHKHLEYIETVFNKEELLQKKYHSFNATHTNNLSTLVPKPFLNKDNLADYLKFDIKVLENDFITADEINNTEITNIYIPFVNINNFLIDQFGPFEYKHSSTVLIETLLSKYKNIDKPSFFVNVLQNEFEIVVIDKNKLQFYNSYKFSAKEDFIYYILFTSEQLNLNPEEFELTFIGNIEKESEIYNITYQYIRNISFLEFPNKNISDNNTISKHSYFTLLNQF